MGWIDSGVLFWSIVMDLFLFWWFSIPKKVYAWENLEPMVSICRLYLPWICLCHLIVYGLRNIPSNYAIFYLWCNRIDYLLTVTFSLSSFPYSLSYQHLGASGKPYMHLLSLCNLLVWAPLGGFIMTVLSIVSPWKNADLVLIALKFHLFDAIRVIATRTFFWKKFVIQSWNFLLLQILWHMAWLL